MRILVAKKNSKMPTKIPTRKRAVDITLKDGLDAQARAYQQQGKVSRQQLADTCSADWNSVHTSVGSFADEHSTL